MIRPLWAIASVAVLGSAGAAGAVIVASSGGEEEVAVQSQYTASAAPTTSVSPTATPGPLPTISPAPSLAPVPAGWLTYTDSVVGFSLAYPPDLVLTDMTEGGFVRGQRTSYFRSPTDNSRAFVVSISDLGKGRSLDQWAIEFGACRSETIQQGTLGGLPAVLCTREVLDGHPEPSIMAEHTSGFLLVSVAGLSKSEFDQLVGSFHF